MLNNDLIIEIMTSKEVIEAISYIYVNVADIQQTNVTVWAKTRLVCTQTEIHFIAPAYSYTK